MKRKMMAFFLTALLLASVLAGCGAPSEEEETMAKIQAANTAAALLEQYENVTITYEYPNGYQVLIFVDQETYLFTDGPRSAMLLFTPQEQCEAGIENGVAYFHRYINPFDADLGAALREGAFLVETTARETVTSLTRENGILSVETQLKAEDLRQEDLEALGFSLAQGEYYGCVYKVDPRTYRILTSEEYIMRADGTREDMGCVTLQVNGGKPEDIQMLEAKGAQIDALPAEQTRVITCIIDPGLETERTVSKTVEKGNYVLFPTDLEGYGIYRDPEGTQPLVSTPGQEAESDDTVYLIKK